MINHLFKFILPLALIFSLTVASQLDSVLEVNKDRTTAATACTTAIASTFAR